MGAPALSACCCSWHLGGAGVAPSAVHLPPTPEMPLPTCYSHGLTSTTKMYCSIVSLCPQILLLYVADQLLLPGIHLGGPDEPVGGACGPIETDPGTSNSSHSDQPKEGSWGARHPRNRPLHLPHFLGSSLSLRGRHHWQVGYSYEICLFTVVWVSSTRAGAHETPRLGSGSAKNLPEPADDPFHGGGHRNRQGALLASRHYGTSRVNGRFCFGGPGDERTRGKSTRRSEHTVHIHMAAKPCPSMPFVVPRPLLL